MNNLTLTRRCLLRSGAAMLAGFDLAPLPSPLRAAVGSRVKVRGSADQCIFIFLGGGMSHVDSFDLKEGAWTPQDFDIREAAPGVKAPTALFPKLTKNLGKVAILRSLETWETEHGRATYYLHAAHPPSPARLAEIPSVGAVVAYEFRDRRKTDDVLPPFISMNYGPDQVKQGFLDSRFTPLNLDTGGSFDFVVPDGERARFERRVAHLRKLEGAGVGLDSDRERQIRAFFADSLTMMGAPEIRTILKLDENERTRYGASRFGDACILARNIVASGRGTRFISITQGGWDFHANIYGKSEKSNQYSKSLELDAGLSALLGDLEARSLLNRTLVVVMGEFGRTTGPITVSKGRDHHRFAMSGLFAGAGIVGGRAIGATDQFGQRVLDGGWSKKRSVYPEDVAATIYSALGIDWTTRLSNTPSGRFFEYVEPQSGTNFFEPAEVAELYG